MDTKLFDIFIEVARTNSFADAARLLDLDPSNVSRSIKQLEHELGCKLIQRTTRQQSLTQAGELFLQRIESISGELAQITEEMKAQTDSLHGKVCISASVAFGQLCIMPFVEAFMQAHPHIQLELKFTDRVIDLVAERVDFAIRLAPGIDANLVRAKLMSTHYRICAAPRYLQKWPTIHGPDDINQHQIISFDLPDYRHHWLFKQEGQLEEVAIHPKLVISSAICAHQAVEQGLGIGILPNWIVDSQIKSGELVNVFPQYQVAGSSFDTGAWIIYPNRDYLPKKTRVGIDFFREKIRETFG